MDASTHKQVFRQLDHDITRFLELVSGSQDLAKVNLQLERLLKHAQAIEEDGLVKDLKMLQTDWNLFARTRASSQLMKIQQDALRIKHEVREL